MRKTCSCRIDSDLVNLLDQRAEQEEVSRSDIMEHALRALLSKSSHTRSIMPNGNSALVDEIGDMFDDKFEQKFKELGIVRSLRDALYGELDGMPVEEIPATYRNGVRLMPWNFEEFEAKTPDEIIASKCDEVATIIEEGKAAFPEFLKPIFESLRGRNKRYKELNDLQILVKIVKYYVEKVHKKPPHLRDSFVSEVHKILDDVELHAPPESEPEAA